MELEVTHVHFDATVWDVKRAIGNVLHGPDFYDSNDPKVRPINFKVQLNRGPGGVRNDGTGTLTLPSPRVGDKFMKLLYRYKKLTVSVQGKKLGFRKTNKPIDHKVSQILDKTPYIQPELEEKREEKLAKLDVALHIHKVQIGVLYLRFEDPPSAHRRFSTEYELSYKHKGAGVVSFEYVQKLIRVQLHSLVILPRRS